jgi:hypothetical protein
MRGLVALRAAVDHRRGGLLGTRIGSSSTVRTRRALPVGGINSVRKKPEGARAAHRREHR